jgi:hypothetical protein
LSIFAFVIEDTAPSPPQQLKKRFESNNDSKNEKDSTNSDGTNSLTASKDSSITSSLTNPDKDKKLNRTQLGAFGNNPSMMKLFDLIRSAYQTHKSLLNSSETDRFGQLLSIALISMKSVLNIVSIQDISKHLEETLNYLKSTFNVEKIKTIQCTQEVILISNST